MALGGIWNAYDPPQRAGVFVNVESVPTPREAVDVGGIVGLVVQADWGPLETITTVESEAQAEALFGTGQTALFAISQALEGEGVVGRSGAAQVLAYRMAAASAAKAAITLDNTGAADALTLTAKYEGTRGNSFRVTVQTNADTVTKDLLLYEGTTLRESYLAYPATDLAALAADINDRSTLITATVVLDGTALANVTTQAFTGGDSGTTILTADHTAAMAAFEATSGFTVFAVDNLTDSTLRGTYRDWTIRLNQEGRTFHTVFGGAASESISTANTRSAALDSPYVVNLWGDLRIDDTTYSSAQMAPRVAGIIAAAGVQRSVTFARIADAVMAAPPSASQVELAVRGYTVPFWYDGTVVRLQRARTTHTNVSDSEPAKFRSLFYMRKLMFFLRRMDAVATGLIEVGISNTENGREGVVTAFNTEIGAMEASQVAIPGARAYLDPAMDQTGEAIYVIFSVDMAPGIEQVLGRLTIPT